MLSQFEVVISNFEIRNNDFFLKFICYIWTNVNPHSPKIALFQIWLKLAQWFWRRMWKCEKFTPITTTTTDNGQIAIGSGELKIINIYSIYPRPLLHNRLIYSLPRGRRLYIEHIEWELHIYISASLLKTPNSWGLNEVSGLSPR